MAQATLRVEAPQPTTQPPLKGMLGRLWAPRIAAGAWAAAVFLLWMPFAIELPGSSGLDRSWVYGIVMAFNRHMQWGHDIIFTFGPLGFLDYNRGLIVDPDVWFLTLSFALIVNLAFATAFAFFLHAFDAHPLTWVLALFVVLLPVPYWALTEIELLLITIIALAVAIRVDRGGRLLAAAGGGVIAVLVLAKGSLLISGGGILAGFVLAAWVTRRFQLIPPALAALVASYVILAAAAGQSLGSLPAYLRSTFELVAGYGPAMSTFANQPPAINPGLIRLCALALVPLTAGEVLIAFRRHNRGLLALTLMCVPMIFVSFKEGFVRWHIDYFVFTALLLQLLILIAILAPRRTARQKLGPARLDLEAIMTADFWRRHLSSLAQPLIAVVLLVPVASTSLSMPNVTPLWPAESLGNRIATYQEAAAMVQSSAERDRMARQAQAIVLTADPLPSAFLSRIGRATVDVMPWDIDVIAVNHLNWTPRPVLQSYASYTSYLDDTDASFIRGPAAPEYVITTLRELGTRYALFEEPAAQRALLERYRVDAVDSNWVLLRRASNICPCAVRELGSVTASTGQAVKPPASAPGERVFARVRLDYSLAGRGANLVLDSGAIRILLTSGGTEMRFRLVPGTAGDGLLLSVLARTTADLATVYSGCETSRAVDSMRVSPDDPALFASNVTYDFFAEQTGPCTPVAAASQG